MAAASSVPTKPYALFDQKGKSSTIGPFGNQTGIWVKGFFHPGCCCKDHDPEQLWAKRSAEITAERQKEQARRKKKQQQQQRKATDSDSV